MSPFEIWLKENELELKGNYIALMITGVDLPPFKVWAIGEWMED